MPDKKWITRKEIIEKTGLSGPELDEYIEIGVIPEPVSGDDDVQIPGIGKRDLFPASVIWRINLVKRLKQEGESIETIAGQFGDISMIEEMTFPDEKTQKSIPKQNKAFDEAPSHVVLRDVEPKDMDPNDVEDEDNPILLENEISRKPVERLTKVLPKLTLEKIDSPAYLLNSRFEIEWINDAGEKLFFDQKIGTINFLPNRNIFKLLLGFVVQTHLNNWNDFVALHIPLFKQSIEKGGLEKLYPGISESEIKTLRDMVNQSFSTGSPRELPEGIRFDKKNGESERFQVRSIQFKEGVLVLYIPQQERLEERVAAESFKEKIARNIFGDKNSSAVSVCALAIQIENFEKFIDALMPNEYFDLSNLIHDSIEKCAIENNGIKAGSEEGSACYYFFKHPETDYIMNAMRCAFCVQEKIAGINHKMKKNGGHENIFINIGISEGTEFTGVLKANGDVEFKVLGATPGHAMQLSRFGRKGEIWATKSGIVKMASDNLKTLTFGVNRIVNEQHHYIPNVFSKVKDVGVAVSEPSKWEDIAELAVTRINGII